MKTIVQKFGGTSVATPQGRERALAKIKAALGEGYQVVVVVSAMGRSGEPYATDTLMGLAQNIFPEIPPRELDFLISCGENIATVVLVQTLKAQAIAATAFTGGQAGIITDSEFGNARICEINPEKLQKCLQGGKVAVVAGFQGITNEGEITTLGRGGSDTTAAAMGVSLKAEVVEIYTDVDGVMTADPRVVPEARSLEIINYNEICEMAHLGAKVIHPRAIEIAREGRVPLRIRSTFSNDLGTLISDQKAIRQIEAVKERYVTGLAHIPEMALVKLISEEDVNQNQVVLKVFEKMAEAGISVDMIQVAPFQIGFIIKEGLAEKALGILREFSLTVKIETGYAKVAIVGSRMRGVPGVMAKMVGGLQKAQLSIYHSTDSHISIACLVKQEDMCQALQVLHEEFGLSESMQ